MNVNSRVLLVLIVSMSALPSYGYIDPGTGSLIIQSIIGAIAAIGVTLKLYWHKLKLFFSRNRTVKETKSEEESSPNA